SCKIEKSDEEETFRQRYWMCGNWAFDPPLKEVMRGVLEPPPLCDFEEWIETEFAEKDKDYLKSMKEWHAEINKRIVERKREEEARKEHIAEEKHRLAAKRKAEREVKLARARRAKAVLEENPDALRKGKWPCCTQ
ncbi:hypothetical protein BS78_07G082400, partial [Paspalum vaginatum]